MSSVDGIDHVIPNWVATGIGGIITALGSAVVFMFKRQSASDAKMMAERQDEHDKLICKLEDKLCIQETRSDKCESDRLELNIKVTRLETLMGLSDLTGSDDSV